MKSFDNIDLHGSISDSYFNFWADMAAGASAMPASAAPGSTSLTETGDDGNDIFTDKFSTADTFNGAGGSDAYFVTHDWGTGNVFNGGDGEDILDVTSISLSVGEYTTTVLGTGAFGVSGQGNSIALNSVESFAGTRYRDVVTGSEDSNSVYGMDGNDLLIDNGGGADLYAGGSGFDTFQLQDGFGVDNRYYGGAGSDLLDMSNLSDTESFSTVTHLGDGHVDFGSYSAVILLEDIENFIGADSADTIYGSSDSNFVAAGAGDDVFVDAEAGVDVFYGMTGDDRYVIGNGWGVDNSFFGGEGSDTLDTSGLKNVANYKTYTELGDGTFEFNSYEDAFDLLSVENFVGSDAADEVVGSNDANDIRGNAGDDTLDGAGGADTIFGGSGDDVILTGSVGAGTVVGGGSGDDLVVVEGTERDITAYGGGGNDTIFSSASYDTHAVWDLEAGTRRIGSDEASVFQSFENYTGRLTYSSHERVYGTSGANILIGADGSNLLSGRDGDDTIAGYGGRDSLLGGDGNDLITGGDGDDLLSGDFGNDELIGNSGTDTILGGDGDDRAFGGDDNDDLQGGAGNDSLFGNVGDDTLSGGSGDDELWGSYGDDVLSGNKGQDILVGGYGADHLSGNNGNDDLSGGNGDDKAYGGNGTDILAGDAGEDMLSGNKGNDRLSGGEGNDSIYGGNGNDFLLGGLGADVLSGYKGQDTLDGGDGDDVLIGGIGDDVMIGGDGADIFVFEPGFGADYIRDFEVGVDTLGFVGGEFEIEDFSITDETPSGVLVTLEATGDTILIYDVTVEQIETFSDFAFATG